MTDTDMTDTDRLAAAWEALRTDLNGDDPGTYGDILARHRPRIEAEARARAGLDACDLAAALAVVDQSYGKTPTYDVPGHCLTCGARFTVRREKGMKPPLSVECPDCECTEYSWREYPVRAKSDTMNVERIAAFLHDDYGCRISCRGGRLTDDGDPSHIEAYRVQAERLIAALEDRP